MLNLFKKFFSKNQDSNTTEEAIDFTTIEGIASITPKNYYIKVNGNPLYYFLQRQATQYKKSGNMDLAIACLRKSNEISDTYERPPLLYKDYLRLPKYIKLTGNNELATFEEQQIHNQHPEFLDKRITNAKLIRNEIQNCQRCNNDFIIVHSSTCCNQCSKYNKKIYSISGRSNLYPPIPTELINGACTNDIISFSCFFPEISTPPISYNDLTIK